MNRFRNVLIVCNDSGSQHALRRGFDLALRNDARVTLIHPVGRLEGMFSLFRDVPGLAQIRTDALESRSRELQSIAQSWRNEGLEVETRLPGGSPFVEVIREVLSASHDLVIVTASDQPAPGSSYFQSLALHLIRKCPCPVWLVSPEVREEFGKILAAVDPREAEAEGDSLSTLILDLATSLARIEESELHVAHVYNELILEGYEDVRLHVEAHEQRSEIEHCVRQAVSRRREALERLLEGYRLEEIPHRIHFDQGRPDQVIPALARDQKIDVLVMGTLSRGKPVGHWMGTTAENIIMNIGCSVLTVKPDEFVSPVQLPEGPASLDAFPSGPQ